jgi:hypothetical protein
MSLPGAALWELAATVAATTALPRKALAAYITGYILVVDSGWRAK